VEWFKTWSNGILRGSLCTAEDSTQLIWIKLLATANETHFRNGRLEFRKGKPMTPKFLISYLNTTPDKFNKALKSFINDIDPEGIHRITIEPDGTIVINKWDFYQTDKRQKEQKEPMTPEQKRGMLRTGVNQDPDTATDVLKHDYGYTVVDNNGEIK
jgi:hypothetical protein